MVVQREGARHRKQRQMIAKTKPKGKEKAGRQGTVVSIIIISHYQLPGHGQYLLTHARPSSAISNPEDTHWRASDDARKCPKLRRSLEQIYTACSPHQYDHRGLHVAPGAITPPESQLTAVKRKAARITRFRYFSVPCFFFLLPLGRYLDVFVLLGSPLNVIKVGEHLIFLNKN